MGFPGGTAVKNLPASSGDITDMGLISGLDDSLEEGMANHSGLENPMYREAWWATVL